MRWSEAYATGIERVDEQHRMIFKMAEDFQAVLDEKVRGERTYGLLLETLDRYCAAHFSFEERCMEEYNCPAAERNKQAHESFVQVLAGYRQRYAEKGFDPVEAQGLLDTLNRWLVEHICGIDVELRKCVGDSGD
ncbi:MAG: hemerythrin family protein [Acidobacteriota bacterium]|nr:hemerythrin family protein [Acidobacteriota bacterium]